MLEKFKDISIHFKQGSEQLLQEKNKTEKEVDQFLRTKSIRIIMCKIYL